MYAHVSVRHFTWGMCPFPKKKKKEREKKRKKERKEEKEKRVEGFCASNNFQRSFQSFQRQYFQSIDSKISSNV
jgi:hypothetical protein